MPDRKGVPDGEIPEGMRADARETWPSRELIESFLGDFDFELRPGETIHVDCGYNVMGI